MIDKYLINYRILTSLSYFKVLGSDIFKTIVPSFHKEVLALVIRILYDFSLQLEKKKVF